MGKRTRNFRGILQARDGGEEGLEGRGVHGCAKEE